MARVLISFLGTGRIKDGTSKREYESTTYKIENSDYNRSFVSVALREHLNIDKMILVGTPHSMWEEVYRTYAGEDDCWIEIGEACGTMNHKSDLSIPHQTEIEQAMGTGSKVVLVKYGLDADEIRANSEIILGLESYLRKGDELILDITHSFRSLPLFVMNLLVFLRDVSPKKIRISGIYYGMLEAIKELGYAPVVNLSEVLNVNSWISGAYSFMEFGNAYKIAELIDSDASIETPKMISTPLRSFAEAKNLNHLAELENQVRKMQILRQTNNLPTIAKMVIDPVVEEFLKTVKLGNGKFKHSDFQYQLAVWHKGCHNYAASYISLNEAILTRACELCGFDANDHDDRDEMRDLLFSRLLLPPYLVANGITREVLNGYAKLYSKVSRNRNAIAHSLRDQSGRITNTVHNMIRDLETFIVQYSEKL